MIQNHFANKTILITGASSGIGECLAERFAHDAPHLVLVARRADRLELLGRRLRESYSQTKTTVIVADLTAPGATDHVMQEARAKAGPIDVLVNNAGVGEYGRFAMKDPAALQNMIDLNISAVIRLTRLALPEMIDRRSGWILNIASMAGFQATPFMAAYGASKAFILQFSEGLWAEVRKHGIVVTCVCPGGVRTEFLERGGYEARREDFQRYCAEPQAVANSAYHALAKGRLVAVPGRGLSFAVFLQRFVPRKWVARISARILGPKR